jgi:diphthamide biosynthesis protein 2
MIGDNYDLDSVSSLITKFEFERVVLQFPDELLLDSIDIFNYLSDRHRIDFFIAADSTYGSSVDDVSAEHVNSDLLVYFGSDLSGSGAMPVMIVPKKKDINVDDCISKLVSSLINKLDDFNNLTILYEPGYYHSILTIINKLNIVLETSLPHNNISISIGKLPPCADLTNWEPIAAKISLPPGGNSSSTLGGLLLTSKHFNNIDELGDKKEFIWYIGEKNEQVVNISFRLSQNLISYYSPKTMEIMCTQGSDTREFRERYGGVSRVTEAQIIGIVIGSMGLTSDLTCSVVDRLKILIRTARKKYYCFVMGRLNEAKLCNFPEVDIYCLVSNEDIAVIKSKTFHVPVITPWELELGLGARDWASCYQNNSISVLDNNLEEAINKVLESLPENPIDSDSDSDDNNIIFEGTNIDFGKFSESTVAKLAENRIMITDNRALEFFKEREFQGLVSEIPENQSTSIQIGQYGIAATYSENIGN